MEPYTYKGWTIYDPAHFVSHNYTKEAERTYVAPTPNGGFFCTACGETASDEVRDQLNAVHNLMMRTGLLKNA